MYDETRPDYDQMGYGNDVLERFWSKVNVKKLDDGSDDLDSCMEWIGAKSGHGSGYGRFSIKYDQFGTHRFIYECFNGPIPEGLQVLHSCDNPSCVNPKHLWVGTIQDNLKDQKNKNRQNKGSDITNSILIEDEVLEIIELLNIGVSHNNIAKKFKVSGVSITNINTGRTWSHLTGRKYRRKDVR